MSRFRLSSLKHPIIGAPMAGGCNTPQWVAGIGRQGGLGSFGFAYSNNTKICDDVTKARQLAPSCPINANFFVFPSPPFVPASPSCEKALQTLDNLPHDESITLPSSPYYPDLEQQLKVVWEMRPEVLTFHFGIPSKEIIQQAHDLNITIGISATCIDEALLIEDAGVDFIILQGVEAGGHRGCFTISATPPNTTSTFDLLAQCVAHPHLRRIPLVASGGLMTGADISRALQLGATAAQLGTVFLPTIESGVHNTYKEYLLCKEGRETVMTRGFSGRWARAIGNEFTDHMQDAEVLPFPLQNTATQPVRKYAQEKNNGEHMSLYAGAHYKKCKHLTSVEQVFQDLAREL